MLNFFARMFPMVNDTQRFAAFEQAASSRRRAAPAGSSSPDSISTASQNPDGAEDDDEPFHPSLFEVLKVRYLLQWKLVAEAVPPEIVDLIIDAAEYWPSSEVSMGERTVIQKDTDRELLRTGPLCSERTPEGLRLLPHRTIHPCRKIVFTIASHDQGWGGSHKGAYETSYTWFNAEIVPSTQQESSETNETTTNSDDPPGPWSFSEGDPHLLPTGDKLQANKAAVRETQRYTITWHHLDAIEPGTPEAEEIERSQGRGQATLDGRRVREMGLGDSISVVGRARFGGWVNHVERLSVRVFWAV